jgi:RHS repeat-associated protein
VVWQWAYSAFGDNKPSGILQATPNPADPSLTKLLKATSPNLPVNLRFPGQYFDSESNLSYNYFRSYDARIRGGYTQFDPTGLAADWNGYAYVRGNALGLTDPWGLRPLTPHEKSLLGPYIPEEDLNGADIHVGEMPGYAPEWATGITRGNDIYFRDPQQSFCSPEDVALLGHELVHVGQYRQGMNWLSYIWASRNGYNKNPYEVSAYDLQRRIQSELKTEDCSCKK